MKNSKDYSRPQIQQFKFSFSYITAKRRWLLKNIIDYEHGDRLIKVLYYGPYLWEVVEINRINNE